MWGSFAIAKVFRKSSDPKKVWERGRGGGGEVGGREGELGGEGKFGSGGVGGSTQPHSTSCPTPESGSSGTIVTCKSMILR